MPSSGILRRVTLVRRGIVEVEALCYKPEGLGFELELCHWFFFFNLRNLSSRILSLRFTGPLTEKINRKYFW
jgi:hypothetical protein